MSAPQKVADLPADVRYTLWDLLVAATERLVIDQHDGIGIADKDGDMFQARPEQEAALTIARDLGLIEAKTPDDPDFEMFGDDQLEPTAAGLAVLAELGERFPCCDIHDHECYPVDGESCCPVCPNLIANPGGAS